MPKLPKGRTWSWTKASFENMWFHGRFLSSFGHYSLKQTNPRADLRGLIPPSLKRVELLIVYLRGGYGSQFPDLTWGSLLQSFEDSQVNQLFLQVTFGRLCWHPLENTFAQIPFPLPVLSLAPRREELMSQMVAWVTEAEAYISTSSGKMESGETKRISSLRK